MFFVVTNLIGGSSSCLQQAAVSLVDLPERFIRSATARICKGWYHFATIFVSFCYLKLLIFVRAACWRLLGIRNVKPSKRNFRYRKIGTMNAKNFKDTGAKFI